MRFCAYYLKIFLMANKTGCRKKGATAPNEKMAAKDGDPKKQKSKVVFQPCFNLFSIVMHDAVSILLILPQRLRCDLNVCSSITPDAKISFSQLSVSAHSFLAISSFECMSARLWGYCASVILAKTLDEDFLI